MHGYSRKGLVHDLHTYVHVKLFCAIIHEIIIHIFVCIVLYNLQDGSASCKGSQGTVWY